MPTKVSILMPVFNGSDYVHQQISSIQNQTYADFRLLIVDDGSCDQTEDIIRNISKNDNRIRIVKSSGNIGQRLRILELIRESDGQFILFADQDDIWHKEKVILLLGSIGSASMAFGRSELIDEKGTVLGNTILNAIGLLPNPKQKLQQLFSPLVSAHSLLMRRTAVNEAAFKRSAPFDWLLSLDSLFSSGVEYVDEAVTFHRLHRRNQMNGSALSKASPPAFPLVIPKFLSKQGYKSRFELLVRIEHLANSPVISSNYRTFFTDLYKSLSDLWFLNRNISPLLRDLKLSKPKDISSDDWEMFIGKLLRMLSGWRRWRGSD